MVQKSEGQCSRAAYSLETILDGAIDAVEIVRADVGHFLPLDVSPNGLQGIQLRRISGQSFHAEPMSLAAQIFGHEAALVRRQTVPDESRFLSAEVAFEILKEQNQAFRGITAGAGLKVQTATPSVRAETQRGTDRKRFPGEGMDQDGRFSSRRPGPPDRGPLGNPAFVLEENPGFPAPSVFFTAGHLSVIQYRIASGLRSRACRAGRWRDQSIAPRSFQTWPG